MPINYQLEGVERVKSNLEKCKGEFRREQLLKVEKASQYLMNYIQRNKLSGQVLKRRTGNLAIKGMNYNVKEENNDIIGRVGNRMPYAKIHEFGGDIHPKTAKYLTIPLDEAKTPAGVLKKPAREWGETFFTKIGIDKLLMFTKETGRPVPIFVLVKSVHIPERPYFRPSIREAKDKIIEIIGEAVKLAVRVANGQ